jgi:type II secretory pathway component PulJ
MKLNSRINSTLLSFALVVGLVGGLMAGQFFTARTMQVAQAASQEHQLAAMQAARGAMNLIKYDMERAGYAEVSPMSHAAFRVQGSKDGMALKQATAESLLFSSSDGRDTVEYRLEGARLSRIATGKESEHVVLLANALNFQVRPATAGSTLNVAFTIPIGAGASASQSPVMAHFVRSTD